MIKSIKNKFTLIFLILAAISLFAFCKPTKHNKEIDICWYNSCVNVYYPSFNYEKDSSSKEYEFDFVIQINNFGQDSVNCYFSKYQSDIIYNSLMLTQYEADIEHLVGDFPLKTLSIPPRDSLLLRFKSLKRIKAKYANDSEAILDQKIISFINNHYLLMNNECFAFNSVVKPNLLIMKHKNYNIVFNYVNQ